MPTRYICKKCEEISDSRFKRKCPSCDKEMKKIKVPMDLKSLIPYLFASLAAALLLSSFFFDGTVLIWLTFPLIGAGLIYDHLYQKWLDKKIRKKIKEKK